MQNLNNLSLRASKQVAILGMPRQLSLVQTHKKLYTWLNTKGYKVVLDHSLLVVLPDLPAIDFVDLTTLSGALDLAIVVGGDGNMLGAARKLALMRTPVIGINRGNLGFLTDLNPDTFIDELAAVLQGACFQEDRFLLEVEIWSNGKKIHSSNALNEAVLHPAQVVHMMEFEVYINDVFAFSLRSDGLIVATPTGSTAYSLSGGGAILSPDLDAISLVPMFPQTLSSRPLVVSGNSKIKLMVSPQNKYAQQISCDGQVSLDVRSGDEIYIYQSANKLKLIHPKDYSYYHVLRNKLGWSNKLF